MEMQTLRDLYIEQLQDIYSAEKQALEAQPSMLEAASNAQLKAALQSHHQESLKQRDTVRSLLTGLGADPEAHKCEGMAGLLREAKEWMGKKGEADRDVLDAGIITHAQRVEHYEIAGYGTVVTYARQLGMHDHAAALEEILDQEKQADSTLSAIAERMVNPAAAN